MAVNVENIQQQLHPSYQQELLNILRGSQDLSREPFSPYQMGSRENPTNNVVAPLSPLQRQAMDYGARSTESWTPFINRAVRVAGDINPSYVNNQNYERYTNPFETRAIRTVADDVTRAFHEQMLPSIQAHFIRRGQHGGSAQRNLVDRATRTMTAELANRIAPLRAYGYEMGGRQFGEEQDRRAKLAELLTGLGRQNQASRIADLGMLTTLGGEQQQQHQNELDAIRREWDRQQAHPYQLLQMRQAIAQGLPFPTQTIRNYEQMAAPQHQVNRAGNLSALAMALFQGRHRGLFGGQ